MRYILLSGGSGKRLWPISSEANSKQFLRFLTDSEGNQVSMIQRIWNQFEKLEFTEKTIISTNESQSKVIQSQIGSSVPIIMEPSRRDTFPAVALACTYLVDVKNVDPSEIVCILPVDSYTGIDFYSNLMKLGEILKDSGADIALTGVLPSYPSTKYGYILPRLPVKLDRYSFVDCFKEKPTEKEALSLIEKHALWNCGVFCFHIQYLLDLLTSKGYPSDYNTLNKQYSDLPKISFDRAVLETGPSMVVNPYMGTWSDLGTWNSLTAEMTMKTLGNAFLSEDSNNSHIINELNIPVAVVGLSNVVVAASPIGILVSEKERCTQILDFVNFDKK